MQHLSNRMSVKKIGEAVPYDLGMAVMRQTMDEVRHGQRPVLLLLQHTPTITLTRSGGVHFLKSSAASLEAAGIALVETDRGGDLTFHGPGQLVGYPILCLPTSKARLHLLDYVRNLENGLVEACTRLGVQGCHRREGYTGVWVTADPAQPQRDWPQDVLAKKLVAIGVGVDRHGITRHGFALNIDIDLDKYTERMVPCGLVGHGVTSLAQELNRIPMPDAIERLISEEVAKALGYAIEDIPPAYPPTLLSPAETANSDGAIHG